MIGPIDVSIDGQATIATASPMNSTPKAAVTQRAGRPGVAG